ncbi:MAG TPA: alpha/beta fold hydrolase [Acidimicrobiales bacterium]|nr:alpha/beta fold hydrolase [Acidimicrobiales bacterium]
MNYRQERVEVADGVELAVDLWDGDSPAFVLVHGLASNARLWEGVGDRLAARGHAVAALDQRGHGRSDKPDSGYDLPTACADLEAAVAGLAARHAAFADCPVLVGQSWGANVVLELAWGRPETARGVVCVDGGMGDMADRFPDWEECARVLAPPRLAGRPAATMEAVVQRMYAGWPDFAVRAALANFEFRQDGTIAPWLTYDRHMQLLKAIWQHRPSTRFPGMKVPVLLVPADDGSEWAAAKRSSVERAAAAIPHSRVHWFSPAHHDLHAQYPDRLAEILHAEATSGLLSGDRR